MNVSAANDKNQNEKRPPEATSNQLGTFGGVFTPSILTILGVIMFMRAGFVVGQAGVGPPVASEDGLDLDQHRGRDHSSDAATVDREHPGGPGHRLPPVVGMSADGSRAPGQDTHAATGPVQRGVAEVSARVVSGRS